MIDQIKIGGFLRELRKEKELTQEQLAEKFGVSSRSVSRWENGNTMPELGILVELADYYEVDIKEIIDGERKSEIMKKEEKETLRKVADYAEAEKKLVVKRRCIVTFIGTLVCALSIMVGYIVFPELPEDSFLRRDLSRFFSAKAYRFQNILTFLPALYEMNRKQNRLNCIPCTSGNMNLL